MEIQLTASSRMAEAEFTGMKCESFPRPACVFGFLPAITSFAEYRMALLGEVHPDLIAPPCFQGHTDLRCIGESLPHFVMGDRQFSLVGGRHGMSIEVFIGCEEAAERAGVDWQLSRDECLVPPLRFAFRELFSQFLGDLQAECDDQQSGDIAVQTMY